MSGRRWRRPAARRLALALMLACAGVLGPRAALSSDGLLPPPVAAEPAAVADAAGRAVEAYVYAYPLVLMELTRRLETNAGDGAPAGTIAAPMNQWAHRRTLPDAATVDRRQPNPDVLESTLWFDVGAEPLVIAVPHAEGRWYTLPMFDLWTDVFAAPGPRTTGGGAQAFALTARGWTGTLPAGVARLEAPTAVGRIVARVRADGPADYPAVHRFQDGLRAVPLGRWGRGWTPPPATYDASRSRLPAADQILRLSTADVFGLFATLTARNPPHPHDHPVLHRMAPLGLAAGEPWREDRLAPDVRAVLRHTRTTAGQTLFDAVKRAGTRVNGWRALGSPIGAYGVDYRRRQVVAFSAFGADLREDVLFFTTNAAADGRPLEGADRYAIHFDAGQLPPAEAFWSLTLYDERQMLAPVQAKRVAIGDRDPLARNADGSLDLVLQRDHPGPARAANWLPLPREGRFTLMLRLYRPAAAALDGSWSPPAVTRVGE